MTRYLVESPHTAAECMRAIEETMKKGTSTLDKLEWGCKAGVHTGWAMIDASSKSEALWIVPEFLRSKARVVPLNKFTEAELKAAH